MFLIQIAQNMYIYINIIFDFIILLNKFKKNNKTWKRTMDVKNESFKDGDDDFGRVYLSTKFGED